MLQFKITTAMAIILTLCSCNRRNEIKNGDLLFRGSSASGLSEAINSVTQKQQGRNYTHMGICAIENDSIVVYHAAPKKGVCREALSQFLCPDSTTNYHTDLFRTKSTYRMASKQAAINAKKYLNLPYDSTYIMENVGYYCSEYIYELYKDYGVFRLNKMTFKNPNSNQFNQIWLDFYNNLGIQIPEGKLGCNPNGMAESNHIEFIRNIK